MRLSTHLWLSVALAAPLVAFGQSVETSDARIAVVDYHPNEVVSLTARRGFVTQIAFEGTESITEAAVGDSANWIIVAKPGGSHVFVKPKSLANHSNLIVVTNARSYSFDLNILPDINRTKGNVPEYMIRFKYAQDPKDHTASKTTIDSKAKTTLATLNRQYSMQVGKDSDSITPTAAYDDGHFTYIRIPPNREIPAIFERGDDDTETLVNLHVQGDLIVIHRVSKRLVLRLGREVVGLWNDAWTPEGDGLASAMTDGGPMRKLKGLR